RSSASGNRGRPRRTGDRTSDGGRDPRRARLVHPSEPPGAAARLSELARNEVGGSRVLLGPSQTFGIEPPENRCRHEGRDQVSLLKSPSGVKHAIEADCDAFMGAPDIHREEPAQVNSESEKLSEPSVWEELKLDAGSSRGHSGCVPLHRVPVPAGST